MPVIVGGQDLEVDKCLDWLKKGGLEDEQISEIRDCLEWFPRVQKWDLNYHEFSMQSLFMNDLKAIMSLRKDSDEDVNSASVLQAFNRLLGGTLRGKACPDLRRFWRQRSTL